MSYLALESGNGPRDVIQVMERNVITLDKDAYDESSHC
jgi:hypothetical protein